MERQAWINDIQDCATALTQLTPYCQSSSSFMSSELSDKVNNGLVEHWKSPSGTLERESKMDRMHSPAHVNTIAHVCWQRNCTISVADYRYALTASGITRVFLIFSIGHYRTGILQWLFIEEVQEQQWMAKIMGRVHSFQFVLLQNVRCKCFLLL